MITFIKGIFQGFPHNIQFRLTSYFLIILLPLVVVSLFANARSQQIVADQASASMQAALTSAMDYIDLSLKNVEEMSSLIATDANLIRLIDKNGKDVTPQSIVDFNEMLKGMANYSSTNNIVSQVSIYHTPSGMLISTGYGGKKIENTAFRDWFSKTFQSNGNSIAYILPEESIGDRQTFQEITNSDNISLVRAMDLYNRERQKSILIITLNKVKLQGMIKTLLPSENAAIYLYNENHKAVIGTGKVSLTADPANPQSDDLLTVQVKSKQSNWSLVLVQPKEELFAKNNQISLFTNIIIGISVLLALGISWVVYSGMASPVKNLMLGMKQLREGNLNFQLENRWKGEFAYLTDAFNIMATTQKHLIEDHYEQQLRMANTELKFLQSQINPHFLYNTLDSIYWTAKNYDADEISEMVMNLSKFFRLSLNKGRDTFTVEESVSHLNYYVRVQQLRFMDTFSVDYRLQEETKQVPILKLLLQPLVENAILHGMETKQENGQLLVSATIEDEKLILMVNDNGNGIDEKRLAYIQSELEKISARNLKLFSLEEENIKDLFGLRNVLMRIKLFYGEEANLTVDSVQGEGTTVTAILPLSQCKFEVSANQSKPII